MLPDNNNLSGIFKNIAENVFQKRSPETIALLLQAPEGQIAQIIPNEEQRYKLFVDIALNEKAETFEKILDRFKNDATVLRAMNDGFKKDEKWSNNRDNHSDWGVSPNLADLEKKRQALQKVVIEFYTKNSAQPPAIKA